MSASFEDHAPSMYRAVPHNADFVRDDKHTLHEKSLLEVATDLHPSAPIATSLVATGNGSKLMHTAHALFIAFEVISFLGGGSYLYFGYQITKQTSALLDASIRPLSREILSPIGATAALFAQSF